MSYIPKSSCWIGTLNIISCICTIDRIQGTPKGKNLGRFGRASSKNSIGGKYIPRLGLNGYIGKEAKQ